MSIKDVLSVYTIDQIGKSAGNYLRFDSGRWSVVRLNRLERLIRCIGFGYQSTKLKFVAEKLSETNEPVGEIASILSKIHHSWKKHFPDVQSPLEQRVASLGEVQLISPCESSASSVGSQVEDHSLTTTATGIKLKMGRTMIYIEKGKLTDSGVESILLPTISMPNYHFSNNMCLIFADISHAIGFDIEKKLKSLWLQSSPSTHPQIEQFPPITEVGILADKGIKKIILPIKRPLNPGVGEEFVTSEAKKQDDAAFFQRCLRLAKQEGVRSFSYSPRNLLHGDSIEVATDIDLLVMEKFIHENPEAFDSIKLIYNRNNKACIDALAIAIETCKNRALLYPK